MRPTVVVSTDKTQLKLGDTATLTFTLSEPAIDFTAADIAVTGGTLSGFTGSGTSYTAIFTPSSASGTVAVASSRFSDAAGNVNDDGADADNTVTLVYDGLRPTVVVSTDKTQLKLGDTATLTFTLSEPAIDFTAADIAVTGGTLSGFTGSGTSYTAVFTPSSASGTVAVAVASGRFSDAAGNANDDGADADNTVTLVYDGLRPTVVVSTDKTQLKLGDTATLTFTLSEPATDFTAADITVTGGTLSGFTGSGTIYTAIFTPSSASGTVAVASGRFSDAAGNVNDDGADADNNVTLVYDGLRPTVVVSTDKTQLKLGDTATLTFTLSEPATDFTAADITVTGGMLSGFTGSGTSYTAVFTPTEPLLGAAMVSVASGVFADAAGNVNDDGSDADNRVVLAVDTLPPPTVSSPVVNEASPYAVFTVSGGPGQTVTLALADRSAIGDGTDFGSPGTGNLQISVDGGNTWANYGGSVMLPAHGVLLARTSVVDDTVSDNNETFTLTATATSGAAVGTATLRDDGSGDVFALDGSVDTDASRSDDRPVSVSSPLVNEASATAVFVVSGNAGQSVSLTLAAGTATGDGTDYGPLLEISVDGGRTWLAHAGPVPLPADGLLLARTSIINDDLPDNNETFTLTATPAGGRAASGTATIRDDGTGSIFNADGSVDERAIADDDRPLSVDSPTVSEASPFLLFNVNAAAGQRIDLALEPDSADVGSDTGTALEVFDGTAWRAYTAGSLVTVGPSGRLLVRVAIVNDSAQEGSESLRLVARNTAGTRVAGTATIKDDGSSANVFNADNTTGTATLGAADDDRPKPVEPPIVVPPPVVEAVPPVELPTPQPVTALPPPIALVERIAADIAAPLPGRIADALTASSGFRVVVIEADTPSLTVFMGITDQFVQGGRVSSFTLPADAFAHTQPDASINLTAKRADGADLPAWVRFDARSGTFQIDAPPTFDGELQVVIIARDAEGREARTIFKMSVGKGQKTSLGRPGLSAQMRDAAHSRPGWLGGRSAGVAA
ncbi:Ig-like domain-containing protein [Roseateles sp. BYS96W]|uniref:Ig-like domain-containing protein n=1 Tax=Pelomonas nitida TaxID=3299027 RepID=A0ABW7G1H3_9BURK